MHKFNKLASYSDDDGNEIVFDGEIDKGIDICFRGKNNKLHIASGCNISEIIINFDCDDGECHIGRTNGKFNIRVGQDSKVFIGNGVTTTARCVISAVEGSVVRVGDDCMLSVGVVIRSDDSHPIFDVVSGKRLNASKNVTVGKHVWLGQEVAVLGGANLRDGCVVGFRSVVKGKFPNNCSLAGIPAKVIRKNIAWERPHLSLNEPFYKPDQSTVKKTPYWHQTKDLPVLKSSKPSLIKRVSMALSIIVRGRFA